MASSTAASSIAGIVSRWRRARKRGSYSRDGGGIDFAESSRTICSIQVNVVESRCRTRTYRELYLWRRKWTLVKQAVS